MINPMTPHMAVTIAKQMYVMLYGLDVTEDMFIQMVATEIYGAAKMENKAAQEIVNQSFCDDGYGGNDSNLISNELASRYEESSKSSTQSVIQPEQQQAELTRVVLATEAEVEALLKR